MKLWLFGTYAWQGNPKALFLYMTQYYKETHDCWWVADNEQDMKAIKQATGIEKITYISSNYSKNLFKKADVYVTENFRESYPIEMHEKIKIFNTWHGVGLKHVELALGMDSVLSDSIVRKYIKNYSLYKNNVLFLTTSQIMEDHFLEDMAINKNLIIRGQYPRNKVYEEDCIHTYKFDSLLPKSAREYKNIILFAPTYRIGTIEGVLADLLPDFEKLEQICKLNNDLFIVKVHPFMKKDDYFIKMAKQYSHSSHILFWNDEYDIYEAFHAVHIAIIDYSSIFYDLLDAGVNKFIRYIPDLESYQEELEMIGDYMDLTEGIVIKNYQDLLEQLNNSQIPAISEKRKNYLQEYFFGFVEKNDAMPKLIAAVDNYTLHPTILKELHSFDIFDTLIRRSTLKPFSIFDYVRDRAHASGIQFPTMLIENWVTIRNKVEHDVRDMMCKTTFERKSDKLEISLDDIYNRLQKNFLLTDAQTEFLKQAEIEAEISHVEPIQQRIDYLFSLKNAGHHVIMVSDMYLPEHVIRTMLERADSRLKDIPLYLSSTIGHQKSTGKLYKYIFFTIGYQYSKWVHYGDNKHADGSVPRRYGIQTATHDIDDFIPFESALVTAMDNHNRYPAYQLATKMHRYRTELIHLMDNTLLETKYYNYAYAGSALVPYINWVIRDALQRNYETLYFISRDGHFLKQIADKIITIKGYKLKTKYIYGSRKAWRLPSFIDKVDDEMFWQFGNFVGMDSFDDLVKASYLNETELLALFPEFAHFKTAKHLRGSVAENIRKILSGSQVYRQKVLDIAKDKRQIVRRYIQQEINPNEKFAFVEFWGRGYTQDAFGRLLNDAFQKEVINPFYYVRSFTDDTGTSLRHNFILAPQDFSFFEPIFAQTPYDSIAGYRETNGSIEAIINPRNSQISDLISEGLLKFTEDYLSLNIKDDDYFDRALAQFSYQYQMSSNNDQFIANVFSELKYNASSFGLDKSYAPALKLEQLQSISSKQELGKLTQSIQISLSKSDEKTIKYYQRIQANYGLPKFNNKIMEKKYAVNELKNYVISNKLPFIVEALQNNAYHMDVSFHENTKRTDLYLKKSHPIEIIAIDWIKNGVPRLLTKYGYITAHKDWVRYLDGVPRLLTKYGYITAHKDWVRYLDRGQISTAEQIASIGKKVLDRPKIQKSLPDQIQLTPQTQQNNRKLRKLARDPYAFFRDAKNPVVTKFRYLFNEQHAMGRIMSKWVRRKLNRITRTENITKVAGELIASERSLPNKIQLEIDIKQENLSTELLNLASDLNKNKLGHYATRLESYVVQHLLSAPYDAKQAFAVYKSSFAERHKMAMFLHQNLATIKQQVRNNIQNSIPASTDKIKVFTYWDNDDKLPEVVSLCRESLKKHIPTEKFDLVILNSETYKEWTDFRKSDIKAEISQAHFTDILRMKLLEKWGGFWIDATCLLTQDFYRSTVAIRKQKQFFFCYANSRVGNWFIYSQPNNYITSMIGEMLILWWTTKSYLTNYFMTHDIIEMLYWIDSDYRNAWDDMLKIHPKSTLTILNSYNKPLNDTEFSNFIKSSFIHKLTYKYDATKMIHTGSLARLLTGKFYNITSDSVYFDYRNLSNKRFIFSKKDGSHAREMCLEDTGIIKNINNNGHPNESSWSVENGLLIFKNKDNQVTGIFHEIFSNNGKIQIHGYFKTNPKLEFKLIET